MHKSLSAPVAIPLHSVEINWFLSFCIQVIFEWRPPCDNSLFSPWSTSLKVLDLLSEMLLENGLNMMNHAARTCRLFGNIIYLIFKIFVLAIIHNWTPFNVKTIKLCSQTIFFLTVYNSVKWQYVKIFIISDHVI